MNSECVTFADKYRTVTTGQHRLNSILLLQSYNELRIAEMLKNQGPDFISEIMKNTLTSILKNWPLM